jgi:hypothetical protein
MDRGGGNGGRAAMLDVRITSEQSSSTSWHSGIQAVGTGGGTEPVCCHQTLIPRHFWAERVEHQVIE